MGKAKKDVFSSEKEGEGDKIFSTSNCRKKKEGEIF